MNLSETIGEIFKFFNNIFPTPKRQIQKVVGIYDTMHKLLETTDIERILIFKAHNGGGVIKPNTPLFISVIYEDYCDPFGSVKELYQRLAIDEEYMRMLAILSVQRSIKLTPTSMTTGLLKDIYEGEGIKYAEKYYLGHDKKNIFYCSLGTSKEGGWQDNAYQRMFIQLMVNNLKNNIK